MNSIADGDFFIRAGTLARKAGVHPDQVKRRIYEGVLVPDALVEHDNQPKTPIFLNSRVEEHIQVILENRRFIPMRATEVVR